eukprot:6461900-Amphidinium_carterae.1
MNIFIVGLTEGPAAQLRRCIAVDGTMRLVKKELRASLPNDPKAHPHWQKMPRASSPAQTDNTKHTIERLSHSQQATAISEHTS